MINMSSRKINNLIPMALRNVITAFIGLVKILHEEETEREANELVEHTPLNKATIYAHYICTMLFTLR